MIAIQKSFKSEVNKHTICSYSLLARFSIDNNKDKLDLINVMFWTMKKEVLLLIKKEEKM